MSTDKVSHSDKSEEALSLFSEFIECLQRKEAKDRCINKINNTHVSEFLKIHIVKTTKNIYELLKTINDDTQIDLVRDQIQNIFLSSSNLELNDIYDHPNQFDGVNPEKVQSQYMISDVYDVKEEQITNVNPQRKETSFDYTTFFENENENNSVVNQNPMNTNEKKTHDKLSSLTALLTSVKNVHRQLSKPLQVCFYDLFYFLMMYISLNLVTEGKLFGGKTNSKLNSHRKRKEKKSKSKSTKKC